MLLSSLLFRILMKFQSPLGVACNLFVHQCHGTVIQAESLDIQRRHIAALTWDAMFMSRRAAILADGGGGGYLTRWMYGVQQKWVVMCRFCL